MIIDARMEELLEFVEVELNNINKAKKLPGGVVIVGGTSKLPGIETFTRDKLQLPARLGRLEKLHGIIDAVQDPSYTTAVGLMILDMLLGNPEAYDMSDGKNSGNLNVITNKLLNKFKRSKST